MVRELAQCGEQLRSSSPFGSDEQPAVIAENELHGAAISIEAVSNKLAQLRPRQVQPNVSIHHTVYFVINLLKCYSN
jgi:hypothetical protein